MALEGAVHVQCSPDGDAINDSDSQFQTIAQHIFESTAMTCLNGSLFASNSLNGIKFRKNGFHGQSHARRVLIDPGYSLAARKRNFSRERYVRIKYVIKMHFHACTTKILLDIMCSGL